MIISVIAKNWKWSGDAVTMRKDCGPGTEKGGYLRNLRYHGGGYKWKMGEHSYDKIVSPVFCYMRSLGLY